MVPFVFKKKPPKVTYFLIISFTSVYLLQPWSSSAVFTYFGLVPKLVMKGYLWQLVTFVFLHSTVLNLLLNLLYLWQLGSDVEKEIGTSDYIKLLIFCVVASGSLMCIARLYSNPSIPIISSFVINYGIIAAYIYLFPKVYLFHKKIKLRYILILHIILSIAHPLVFGNLGASSIGYLFVRLKRNPRGEHNEDLLRDTNDSVYKVGQVWNYNSRPGEEESTLTIVKVESHPKLGVIVHISLQGLKLKNSRLPNGIQNSIPHGPFSEEAIQKSVTKLNRITQGLPDFQEGYNNWRDARGGIWSISVSEAIDTVEKGLNKISN